VEIERNIVLRAQNSRQFRNFAILRREATFAIRLSPEGSDIAHNEKTRFVKLERMHDIRAN